MNNKYYILDATATCYNPGSFLEDYNGFWYKADGMSSHNVCGSEFSSKNIPASNVKYLGASGNDLYVSTNAGYYVNEGTGDINISNENDGSYNKEIIKLIL